MKTLTWLMAATAIVLIGCQSAPKTTPVAAAPTTATPATAGTTGTPAAAPTVVDASSVTAGDTGFSPLAQAPHNFLSFALHFAHPDQVVQWTVDFVGAGGTVVHTVKGQAPRLPPNLTWDGNDDTGKQAPEGTYQARLSVDYGTNGGVQASESASFLLDITPPSGTIAASPQPYEPGDPNIMVDPPKVTFAVTIVPGAAPVASWRLAVIHPDGRRFMDFISEDHKDNQVAWNGRAQNNASLEAGITYNVEAQVFDRYGNVGTLKGSLTVGKAVVASHHVDAGTSNEVAPVTVSVDGQLVAATQIYFPAYSADLSKVGPAKKEPNEKALDALATALKAASGTKIKVVGHANKVFWQDQTKGDREQKSTLIPLSTARAQAVRDALVARGIDPKLFDVTGVGAEGNLAPYGDVENNWKNRRVEFQVESK